jgi:hypothetical protein
VRREVVKDGDQFQVQVQVKAAVNDHVHDDDHLNVNALANYRTRCR